MRLLSRIFFLISGWKVLGAIPLNQSSVVIAYPHKTAWDFPLTLLASFFLRLNLRWVGKQELFPFLFRGVMLWLGGIPVNRQNREGVVKKCASYLRDSPFPVHMVISPQGTRKKEEWRSGFYYIAQEANVPITLAHINYSTKTLQVVGGITPSGNYEKDLAQIISIYKRQSQLN